MKWFRQNYVIFFGPIRMSTQKDSTYGGVFVNCTSCRSSCTRETISKAKWIGVLMHKQWQVGLKSKHLKVVTITEKLTLKSIWKLSRE